MKKPLQKNSYRLAILLSGLFLLSSCWGNQARKDSVASLPDIVFYEIFVQSFADSNKDSIGDLVGLNKKLDYLCELGIKGIWLMPIHPSPSYHKYDVSDYMGIHPQYGKKEDFKELVEECHKRGISVIIDMVLNHSSATHPWFLDAKKSANSKYRNYFVWSSDSGLIRKDPKHWYRPKDAQKKEIEREKFYGYFSQNMPDLNYDNPKVKEEALRIADYWLKEMDVDGFRLDAARHIFPEDRMLENYAWWKEFSAHVKRTKPGAYIVGEVWDTEAAVLPFLDHSLPSAFNFGLCKSLVEAIRKEKDSCVIGQLVRYHKAMKANDSTASDAIFLSNHDQERIMTTIGNDIEKAKLAASLLLTLEGTPFIYYGEEIGMLGAKPDKYIREPILWDTDIEDGERTRWIKALFTTTHTVAPIKKQALDSRSLLNHYRRLIKLRNSNAPLCKGKTAERQSGSEQIISFYREYKNEKVLVIHNLSEMSQTINLEGQDRVYTKLLFSTVPHSLVKPPLLIIAPYASVILSQ